MIKNMTKETKTPLNFDYPEMRYIRQKKKKKVVLTATISEETYQKLKRLIPEGEVSKFVEKLVQQSVRKIEENIQKEYEQINHELELAPQLEKLNICHEKSKKK
jgi:hypothetical protein